MAAMVLATTATAAVATATATAAAAVSSASCGSGDRRGRRTIDGGRYGRPLAMRYRRSQLFHARSVSVSRGTYAGGRSVVSVQ